MQYLQWKIADEFKTVLESVESRRVITELGIVTMTLEDIDKNQQMHSTEKQNINKMDISEALTDVIVQAVADDRVTMDISEALTDVIVKAVAVDRGTMDLSEALTDVIVKAVADDRLTFGVYDSAMKIDKECDDVLVCIQVENPELDVALQIHLTLLEAYCHECDIKLVKVTNQGHLAKLLDSVRAKNKNGTDLDHEDIVCMVVQEPHDSDEDRFTEIYHTQKYNWHPHVSL
ncbi:uncharacterized protein [Antedon mediterranea]|uniref:uncharacterized protein n=1 Tax=Antedon mediterranea TaxID=105859 RepID=UPI003AF7C82A